MIIAHPTGNYRFLRGIEPYSCGVIADPGYEIIHFTLERPIPWRAGFDRIDACLQELGRQRTALCGVELRSPAPFTLEGFIDFNRTYCTQLQTWNLYVDDLNPLARTNVAPLYDPPREVVLHGFCCTVPAPSQTRPTLVVAGAGELRGDRLAQESIIRPGDTTPAAMREKAGQVMNTMTTRLRDLGGDWDLVTAVAVYTIHLGERLLEDAVLPGLGMARRHGIGWYPARPPVVDIDFEMDLRGVCRELMWR